MESTTNASNQYLSFTIAQEEYAIPVGLIREVLTVPKITRIPQMPVYVPGVINLRGMVVPLIDLSLKLGIGETKPTGETAIIVIETRVQAADEPDAAQHIGLYVDAVRKVMTIGKESIGPAPTIGTSVKAASILGIGNVDGGFIVILNIADVITSDDLAALEDASTAKEPKGA